MQVSPGHDGLIREIEQHGFVVVRDLLSDGCRERACTWADSLLDNAQWSTAPFDGDHTRRVYNLLPRLGDLEPLLTEPTIREVLRATLGEKHQFGMLFLTAVDPGQAAQMLHYDAGVYPLPRDTELELNVIWALDDFTADNGATVIAPGSHRWPAGRRPEPHEMQPVEMPSGSALLYSGRLWHGAGANHSTDTRRALIAEHLVPWLRPADNQALAAGRDALQALSPELRTLAGVAAVTPYFGFIGGGDPAAWLDAQ